MHRCCLECPKWQGTPRSTWGDCHHVCGVLFPELNKLLSPLQYKVFSVPFDPHDLKYFYYDRLIRNSLKKAELPDGVRRHIVKEQDITFILDKDGEIVGERTSPHEVIYFSTHKGFGCDLLFP